MCERTNKWTTKNPTPVLKSAESIRRCIEVTEDPLQIRVVCPVLIRSGRNKGGTFLILHSGSGQNLRRNCQLETIARNGQLVTKDQIFPKSVVEKAVAKAAALFDFVIIAGKPNPLSACCIREQRTNA